jgi:Retrotransposon gag protein
VEWLRKCHSYFELHQIPDMYKTHLATIQFHEKASVWYDGYLIDHDPPPWRELVRLVQSRFTNPVSSNTLDNLKHMNQIATVNEYIEQFEKLRSRILLEGRNFSERDFMDSFISGLKGELKPMVMTFKPPSLVSAYEYALYMESAVEIQQKRWRTNNKVPLTTSVFPKAYNDKGPSAATKPNSGNATTKSTLIDQRRALGLCFKCGDKYYPGHQCKFKIQMLQGDVKSRVEVEEELLHQKETEDI